MTLPDRPLSPATRAAQALGHLDLETGAIVPAIALSTTYARDAQYAARRPYIYARDGGETVERAEALLADLDGAAATLLFSSGMAAFVALLESVKAGERVAAPDVMYHGGLVWLERLAERRGIGLDLFDPAADGALEAALRPGATRLLWVETPTNPTWEVIDIAAAARASRAAGCLLAVDCTVAPPCTVRALALGADIAFHSATKYLGGHSDLTAGALSFAETGPLHDEVAWLRKLMGSILPPFEAWLLIRGMRTLYLRYERASATALAIARHFGGHAAVEQVLYPGLPGHPRHEVAAAQMDGGFGGMLSFLVRGGYDAAQQVVRATRLFLPATSLGGVESLIEHRRAIEPPSSRVPPSLVRLSVGIEDPRDLIDDLERALATIA
jgi:cystathionine gamma-synthase